MKKFVLILFLVIEIKFIFCIRKILAANFKYISEIYNYNHLLTQAHINKNLPITIDADYAKGNYPYDITFTGNINIKHGNDYLRADKVQLYQKQSKNELIQTVYATGNVHYSNNQIILNGPKGLINLNTKDIKIWSGNYQILNNKVHGRADIIKYGGEDYNITLENGLFTFCPLKHEDWSIFGKKIIYNHKKQITEIWNARFKLGSIPIFYSPYLQIPTSNNRHSGFLVPNFKYSTSKYFKFCFPYYWNIAPNVDITFNIPYYTHKYNNIMWENELRYSTYVGTGFIELDCLPSSKFFKNQHLLRDNYHWLFCWKHTGILDYTWYFNIDYTKANHPYYFKIFHHKYISNTNEYAVQNFNISYKKDNFITTVSTKQFQMFDQKPNTGYCAKPQVDMNWYSSNTWPFSIHIYAQAAHFININSSVPELTRLHFEPIINLPLIDDLAKVNLRLMATHYQQKSFKQHNTINKKSANKVIPQLKINSKLVFVRDINWIEDYTQMLETHIQYLYMPYRNQKKIQNCDSYFLFDYNNLFCDNPYIGLDKISSIKQIKTNFITRIYDGMATERFNISMEQIYCFNKSNVNDTTMQWKKHSKTNSLVFMGSTYWYISNHWGLRGSLYYDINLNRITTSNGVIEYLRDNNRLIQLTYRNANSQYIKTILPERYIMNKNSISQVGSIVSWPITNRLSIASAYYFSTTNKLVNQVISLQYNFCCYAVRIVYEHKLNNRNIDSNQSKYDKTINFNIVLRGLSSSSNLDVKQVLHSDFLPYHSLL